jgi:histidinol-phosphatase
MTTPQPPVIDVEFLHTLADLADAISMPHFEAQDFVVETKADRTEVTIADRSTEAALTDAINARFPDHQVLGEEFGVRGSLASGWRWILDPIDGTSNFTRGVPMWATLIAAEHNGVLQAAMVSCPGLHKRWWALAGTGSFTGTAQSPKVLRVSKVSKLADTFISFSDGHWTDTAMRSRLQGIVDQCARQRCFGDFWQHMLVAEGAIDAAVEPIVSLWDLAAVQLIVEQAGGTFTDIAGDARPDGGSAVSSNGLLHQGLLAALHGAAAEQKL